MAVDPGGAGRPPEGATCDLPCGLRQVIWPLASSRMLSRGRSVGEADGEFGESIGLADHVDLGDLGVLDVDRQCDAEPAVGCDDEAGIAIYQCRPRKACRGPGVA